MDDFEQWWENANTRLTDLPKAQAKFIWDAAQNKQAEPVAYMQVYKCKIKSKARIDREIPREKQGWWADIAAGGLIRLRQANQADIDRCTLNDAHSKNPNDYMCETFKNGSLVAKIALEYMNPDENVFAQVYTHPAPAVAREPVGYQFRTRSINHPQKGWSAWEPCDKNFFDACRKIPILGGTEQEAREVYAEAPAVAVNENLLEHLKSAHAFIEETAAFGKQAKKGILQCGESIWYIDKSKEAIAQALAHVNETPKNEHDSDDVLTKARTVDHIGDANKMVLLTADDIAHEYSKADAYLMLCDEYEFGLVAIALQDALIEKNGG